MLPISLIWVHLIAIFLSLFSLQEQKGDDYNSYIHDYTVISIMLWVCVWVCVTVCVCGRETRLAKQALTVKSVNLLFETIVRTKRTRTVYNFVINYVFPPQKSVQIPMGFSPL